MMLTPDRQAETRAPTVADQIRLANVLRVERDHETDNGIEWWTARLGPRAGGITRTGPTPEQAAVALILEAARSGWSWDSEWRDQETGE
jgi:hypothetical protein